MTASSWKERPDNVTKPGLEEEVMGSYYPRSEYTDKKTLFTDPKHPYTEALLSAVPIPDPRLRRNKLVLRHAVGTFMPEAFARRPKHPQRIREDQRFCDVLASIASPLLTPDRIRMRGIFDPQELQRLLNRPSGKPWPPEHAMRVWTAVLTEIWAETFLDGNGLPTRRANADAAQTVHQSPSRDRAAAA